jgi:predicted metal-binding membrane protein
MANRSPLEAALRRDRWVTLAALAVVIAASWGWVLSGAGMGMSAQEMSSIDMALGPKSAAPMTMGGATGMEMATPARWDAAYAVLMFFMWWVMMLAMMLPSASPTILLFAAIKRRVESPDSPALPSIAAFTAGYGAAWAGFSLLAIGLQWAFEWAGLLSPMMLNATSLSLAGGVLVAAGLYQLTPLKQACLRHCRSPAHFLSQHWRKTVGGAFGMGVRHGVYCLGCCWALMALLFFGGVMNLWWVAGLAVLVAVEKLVPRGVWFGYTLGAGLTLWGLWFLWQAFA